jgi:manganese/iron transport system permease protein
VSSLLDSLGSLSFQRALVEAVLVGATAGIVGVHVLLRRLPFFVVAMSHATFPGVVIASTLGVSLFVGGWTCGLVVALLVARLGSHRALDDTSAIGVVLAGAFAIGVLVISSRPDSSRDVTAFLVGSVLTVTPGDIVTTAVTGALVVGVLAALHKELVLGAFDPVGAAAAGYRTGALGALVLVVVTITLVTAVPAVGTLLAVALLTVPALAARLWTDRVVPAMVLAAAIGAGSGVIGLCVSTVLDIAAGAAIALTCTAVLVASAAPAILPRRNPLYAGSARQDRSGGGSGA